MQSFPGLQATAAYSNSYYPTYPSRHYVTPQAPPRRIGHFGDQASAASAYGGGGGGGGGYGSGSGSGHGGDVASSTAVNALALLSFMYFLKLIQHALSNKKMMMMTSTGTPTATATVTGTGTPTGTSTGTSTAVTSSANAGMMRMRGDDGALGQRSQRSLPFDWETVGEGAVREHLPRLLEGTPDVTVANKTGNVSLSRDGSSWLEEFRDMMKSEEDDDQDEIDTRGGGSSDRPQRRQEGQEKQQQQQKEGLANTARMFLSFLVSSATSQKKQGKPAHLKCFQITACEAIRKVKDNFGNTGALVADILTNMALPTPEDDDWSESVLEAVTSGRNDGNCRDLYPDCPEEEDE